jgi:hypothetical protein
MWVREYGLIQMSLRYDLLYANWVSGLGCIAGIVRACLSAASGKPGSQDLIKLNVYSGQKSRSNS